MQEENPMISKMIDQARLLERGSVTGDASFRAPTLSKDLIGEDM